MITQGKSTVMWFQDLGKDDIPIAGGKGANLGEMFRAGLPIPNGFVVAADDYKRFLAESGLAEKILSILSDTDVDDSRALQAASKKIRKLFEEVGVPESIKKAIIENYRKLDAGKHVLVAVRSSATAEDLPGASFAGQQETFLNTSGNDLVDAVKRCWSSLFTPRAIFYREKKGFEHAKVAIAVVVQEMVNSEKAGVLFTVHPATGETDKLIIEGAWGLGEGVVSGTVTPDHYVIDKKTGSLLIKEITTKEVMFVRDEKTGKTVKKKVPLKKANEQTLTEDEIKKLAQLGMKVESHYGFPQDIEWAIEGSKLYLLQTRPITVFYEEKAEKPSEGKEMILKGLGASPGMGSGTVKILSNVEELDKVLEGNILVATMTNPDMVPAMKRASAIVTDEGGMTCIGAGTKLLTDVGFLNIEEVFERVKRGEERKVLSLDVKSLKLRWRKIANSMKRRSSAFKLQIYEHNRKKDFIWITPNHKMLALNKRLGIDIAELKDVIDESKALLTINRIPNLDIAYDAIEADLYYLAGALASDGSIAFRNGKPVGVRFTQKYEAPKFEFVGRVIELFKRHYGYELKDFSGHKEISYRGYSWKRVSEFSCNRKKPAEFLYGFKGNCERIMLKSNDTEVLEFLAGYVDGDGHYNEQKGSLEIYAGEDDLKALVIASLRFGVRPMVRFRGKVAVLIIPNSPLVGEILRHCTRIKAMPKARIEGLKKFAAGDLIGEIKGIDWRGWLHKYVKKNLLIDTERLYNYLRDERQKEIVEKFRDSDLASIRCRVLDEEKIDVYNITVEADNDLDHNYVIFTEEYTPIVVGNCHAAIVSRELGIPCVVGTGKATKTLSDGMEITVDGSRGGVYTGLTKMSEKPNEAVVAHSKIITATDVKANISMPEVAPQVAPFADGVGLLRVEHLILGIGKHPIKFIKDGEEAQLVQKIADGVRKVAEPFYPKPVWYRTLDAPTDEFRSLIGGEEEPLEHNPMLGWRGIRRGIDQPELLAAEYKAIKKLVSEGLTNIGVMIPLVQHPEELREAKRIATQVGLIPHKDVSFGIMVEIPAAALIIEDFIAEGIDFISFGTNDLTQYTLAVDRNNERVAKLYTEKHKAVMKLMEMVIKKCREAGVETSICGQAGSDPEVVKKLVEFGISSVSANPDAVQTIREMVARTEQRLLLDKAR